jgi:hypothetical protein
MDIDEKTEAMHVLMDKAFEEISNTYLKFGESMKPFYEDDPFLHIYATYKGMQTIFARTESEMKNAVKEKVGIDYISMFDKQYEEAKDVDGLTPQ